MNQRPSTERTGARRWRGALLAMALLAAGSALAQTPVYSVTQADAVTGDNAPQNFSVPGVSCTGCRLPDANATGAPVDDYRQDIYERPTGSGSSANVYYAALDITSGQVGYDGTWLYYRINLYGIDTPSKWLPYYYAFEINFDSDARGDLFVRVEDPSGKVGGSWGTSGVVAYWDQNNNHGATNPTLPDYNGGNDGYENLVFDQGSNNRPGKPGGSTAIVARVVGPASAPAVELAVKRVFLDNLNGGPVQTASFRPYTAKGGGTTAANNLPLHDKYGRLSGGSPFPWLALTGAPATCPNTLAAENALTAAQQAALASGTNVNTGINNPCYPSGGNIVEMDNGGTISGLVSGGDISFVVDITGRVFEDVNYGGGAGRPCGAVTGSPACSATSGAVGRSGARVELYTVSGTTATYSDATTTNANGDYTFANRPGNATYLVRVVNNTVTSSRSGAVSGLLPVQTFRTSGLSGNVGAADVNRVGGERPNLADGGNGGNGDTIDTTTGAASGLASGNQAQSITVVSAGTQDIAGIDFGFNFSTVVNTNDSGQGSLRQFILNSNALGGEGSLAQAGSRANGLTGAAEALPAGKETSIFMIPDGSARPGLRAGLINQLTGGVAQIQPATALPAITGPHTVIDGGTQTFNVGNTNAGVLGTGGTVGVDGLALPTVQRPEVFIRDPASVAIGLDVQASNVWVRGLAISGFGNAANSNSDANIRIGDSFTGTVIEQSVLGASATSFADPGTGSRSGGDNIRSVGGDLGTIRNNLIGFSAGKGIGLESGSNGWIVSGNEVRGNAIGNPNFDGIDIESAGSINATVSGNLFIANEGVGIDSNLSGGGHTIVNNTVTGNGIGAAGAALETPGIRIFGSGSVIDRNVIHGNVGAGVYVTSGATGNRITRNSIYNNGTAGSPPTGQIGIDLGAAGDDIKKGTAPFVTLNDAGDADSGGNDLLNFPVLTSATISGGNLTLAGYARPGAVIELFIAAPDPSGFGEGQTYLVTLTEGSGADADATTGTYGPGPVNGIAQGIDTTNRFLFTIPVPGGVTAGTRLTATATVGSNTSEFSGLVTVTAASVPLTHVKSVQVVSDPFNGAVNPKAIPGAVVQYSLLIANPGTVAVDNNSIAVTDPIPAHTRLFLGDLGGPGSGPVAFVNGVPSSGLTWTFTSLGSGTDDLEFSNDGGVTWTHVPTADGSGFDNSGTTHIRMRPKGTMAAYSGSGSQPSFELRFRVRID